MSCCGEVPQARRYPHYTSHYDSEIGETAPHIQTVRERRSRDGDGCGESPHGERQSDLLQKRDEPRRKHLTDSAQLQSDRSAERRLCVAWIWIKNTRQAPAVLRSASPLAESSGRGREARVESWPDLRMSGNGLSEKPASDDLSICRNTSLPLHTRRCWRRCSSTGRIRLRQQPLDADKIARLSLPSTPQSLQRKSSAKLRGRNMQRHVSRRTRRGRCAA